MGVSTERYAFLASCNVNVSNSTRFPTRRKQTLPEICRQPIYDMKIHVIWNVKPCRRFDVPKEGSAFFFLDCLMLKMKPLGFITTAVATSLSTGCYIQENLDLRHQRCEIHKSRSFWYLSVFRDTGLICLSSITISRTAVGLNQTTVCWIAHLYAFLFARCSEQITPVLYTVPLASVFGFEDYWIKVSERLQIVTPFLHVVTCIFSNQQYMSKHKRSFAKPLPHGKNKTNSWQK